MVESGLSADATTERLYRGAIFLTQIACYAGIYDPEGGCPLIQFDGGYGVRGLDATTYPEPERFLARSVTRDGNPA